MFRHPMAPIQELLYLILYQTLDLLLSSTIPFLSIQQRVCMMICGPKQLLSGLQSLPWTQVKFYFLACRQMQSSLYPCCLESYLESRLLNPRIIPRSSKLQCTHSQHHPQTLSGTAEQSQQEPWRIQEYWNTLWSTDGPQYVHSEPDITYGSDRL